MENQSVYSHKLHIHLSVVTVRKFEHLLTGNLYCDIQVEYLHTLVQSRLVDTDTPLQELYIVLHTFCQSLQLEVLHSQVSYNYLNLNLLPIPS